MRDGKSIGALYERLRTAILFGELEPGSSVSLPQLAVRFGAGRTPLREALRMLQGEGLVVAVPNQRVRIASVTAEDFEEIWIARLALEAVAVRLTVPALGAADFATLEGYMAQMDHYQKVGDHVGMRAPHRAFHHTLVAAAGSRMSAEISGLADYAGRYWLRFGAHGNWHDRRAEHRAILDAAVAGDADGAADRLAEHYIRTILLLFDALDPSHDLGRLRATVRAVTPRVAAILEGG